jgi:hypothetical protein
MNPHAEQQHQETSGSGTPGNPHSSRQLSVGRTWFRGSHGAEQRFRGACLFERIAFPEASVAPDGSLPKMGTALEQDTLSPPIVGNSMLLQLVLQQLITRIPTTTKIQLAQMTGR